LILYFARLCQEVGLPPGVINIVLGRGSDVGEALVSHAGVDKISFTGSTPVGINVGLSASRNINPVTLELGGKSPMLVFEDAEIDAVVEATQQSVFFNTGQVCSAGSRLYVQRAVHLKIVSAIVERATAMKVGDVLSDKTRWALQYLNHNATALMTISSWVLVKAQTLSAEESIVKVQVIGLLQRF